MFRSQELEDVDDDGEIPMSSMLQDVGSRLLWPKNHERAMTDLPVSKRGLRWFHRFYPDNDIVFDWLTFTCFNPEFFNRALELIKKERKESQAFAWIDWAITVHKYQ